LNVIPESERYYINKKGKKKRYRVDRGGTAVDHLIDEINREASSAKKQADKDLNQYLEEKKTHKVAHTSQRWPGADKKSSERHQKMVTDFFIKRSVPSTFAIKKDGKLEDAPGGVEQLGLKEAKVVGVDWLPDPVSGEIMYALTVQGNNENDITSTREIFVNAEQVRYLVDEKTDFVQNSKNNTAYRIEHKAHKAQYSFGLNSTIIDIQKIDSENTVTDFKYEYNFGQKTMTVFVLTDDGYKLAKTYQVGSDAYYDALTDPNIRVNPTR
jgi:hypothetical protein